MKWHEGFPPHPYDKEWFIAETTYGDRVVLRRIKDELHAHDFETADATWMKKECVKRWMQFPDSEYKDYEP